MNVELIEVRDAGEGVADRYTAFFQGPDGPFEVALSDHPSHPQGVCMHVFGSDPEACGDLVMFDNLPAEVQAALRRLYPEAIEGVAA